jgi:uncharacterized membrane protein YedE/YeeE
VTATEFTPVASAIGGGLIGLAAVLLMLFSGRIAGISGILRRLLPPYHATKAIESAAFISGLIAAPLAWHALTGDAIAQTVSPSLSLNVVAGLLVGFGAILGGGCTSGHGVCGLSRLSKRSLVGTLVFMATAAVTVFITRHVVGGWQWP